MSRIHCHRLLLSLACLLTACSSVSAQPVGPAQSTPPLDEPPRVLPAAREPAHGARTAAEHEATPEPGRLRLGHYATRDGLVGLVIDRTGAVPRARIDGAKEVFDLAVRRASTLTSLISLNGELLIEIDNDGHHTIVSGISAAPLTRDGNAEPLPPATEPTVDAPLLRRLEAELTKQCGSAVRIADVKPTPGSERGLYHGVHRAARAVSEVCGDKLGRDAVARSLKGVRLSVSDGAPQTMKLEGGQLLVVASYGEESFGPFVDELRSFLESRL